MSPRGKQFSLNNPHPDPVFRLPRGMHLLLLLRSGAPSRQCRQRARNQQDPQPRRPRGMHLLLNLRSGVLSQQNHQRAQNRQDPQSRPRLRPRRLRQRNKPSRRISLRLRSRRSVRPQKLNRKIRLRQPRKNRPRRRRNQSEAPRRCAYLTCMAASVRLKMRRADGSASTQTGASDKVP
jgi:hypothetical protein